jgi:hypothetical protein
MPSSHDNFSWLFGKFAKSITRRPQPFSCLDRAVKLLNAACPLDTNYRGLVAAMMTA